MKGGPQCRMSNLRHPHVPLSVLRNGHVAMSNLGVKGPTMGLEVLLRTGIHPEGNYLSVANK